MRGDDLKKILKEEGYTLAVIAELLGFEGDQRLHSALKSDNIKTQLLEEVARVTNKTVGYFYDALSKQNSLDNNPEINGDGNTSNLTYQRSSGDNSPNVNGDNNHIGGCATIDSILEEAASQRALTERTLGLLEKRDAQIDEMLAMMKTLIGAR